MIFRADLGVFGKHECTLQGGGTFPRDRPTTVRLKFRDADGLELTVECDLEGARRLDELLKRGIDRLRA